MKPANASSLREDLKHAGIQAGNYPQNRFSGRGLVVCAGGAEMLTNAYVLVRILREQLRCTLPIEIWHIGPREMPPLVARMLLELDCAIVDALTVLKSHPANIQDGWQLKPFAIINSAFEEAILLDADQVPVINPALIFDWPKYRETGAVFWPDINELSEQNPVWQLLDMQPRRARSFESGQICVNKKTHWKPLAVALRINELAEIFYELVYGDKDTFMLAWLLAEANFSLVPHPPMCDLRFLAQRDFAGSVVFQHRTNCKWSLLRAPYRSPEFVFQSECEAILDELREVWNGRNFHAPARSTGARALESEIALQRWFTLQFGDRPASKVTFLPGHQFGYGRSAVMSNWCIRDTNEGYELIIYSTTSPSFVFPASGPVPWIGKEMSNPPEEALLDAAASLELNVTTGDEERGLADEYIDLALGGTPTIPFDRDHLRGALMLLSRVEFGVGKRLLTRAQELEAANPGAATVLREIAATLPAAMLNTDARPNRQKWIILKDPKRYLQS
jgi:hypothetical protein